MPRKDASGGSISAQAQQELVSEGIENFELPKSLVTKIAKSSLPDNVKLQKETVLALVKGSTVFINYLAATAQDVALSKQHKSISASDIIKALELLNFGHIIPELETQVQAYRDNAKGEKPKKASGASTSAARTASSSANKSSSISVAIAPNGNPYPVLSKQPKSSNPYPSVSNASSAKDSSVGLYTNEPLNISASDKEDDAPMDVDDTENAED